MTADVTVITISYERKVFLQRYLETAKNNNLHTILVDGSDSAYSGLIPDNVDYFHMPGETAAFRMAFAIKKVMTPYVVVLADDDFLLPSAVVNGARFLNQNPDYSSVQGRALTFNERFEKSGVLYKSYKGFDNPVILNSNSETVRLETHMSHYAFTFYSLQRTAVWQRFFDEVYGGLKDHPVFIQKHPSIFELVQSVHCILSGKNKMFDDVYLVRESIPRPTQEIKENHFHFNETDEFDNFLQHYSRILNRMFTDSDVAYYRCLKRAFAIFAEQRRAKSKEGNVRTIGGFLDLLQGFQKAEPELTAIHDSIIAFREPVLEMLNVTGLPSASYWYDENWKQHVASRFELLINQYSNYVIYGAGEHTEKLANSVGLGKGIRCIADSNERRWGKKVMGIECIDPSEILDFSQNVIISSQNFEKEISQSLTSKFGNNVNVLTLYE